MKRWLFAAGAVLVTPFLVASGAFASPISIGVCQQSGSGACTPGSTAATDAGTGLAFLSTTFNAFTMTVSAVGTPLLPQTSLNSQTIEINSTTANATLDVYITLGNNPADVAPTLWTTILTSNGLTGATGTQALDSAFLDPANGLFSTAGGLLGSHTFTGADTSVPPAVFVTTIPSLFSVTELYQVTFKGCTTADPCSANLTANVTGRPVPEPASMLILGASLLGFAGMLGFRRRHNAV